MKNANTVKISPAPGSVALVGTQDVSPATTTTYTLTATNSFGSVSANVTVNVAAAPTPPALPVITSFTANPAMSTVPGSAVVLTCLATGAARVVISGIGNVNSSGSLTVNPTTTSTYVCVAINSAGAQVAKNLTVPVDPTSGGGTGPPVVGWRPGMHGQRNNHGLPDCQSPGDFGSERLQQPSAILRLRFLPCRVI